MHSTRKKSKNVRRTIFLTIVEYINVGVVMRWAGWLVLGRAWAFKIGPINKWFGLGLSARMPKARPEYVLSLVDYEFAQKNETIWTINKKKARFGLTWPGTID